MSSSVGSVDTNLILIALGIAAGAYIIYHPDFFGNLLGGTAAGAGAGAGKGFYNFFKNAFGGGDGGSRLDELLAHIDKPDGLSSVKHANEVAEKAKRKAIKVSEEYADLGDMQVLQATTDNILTVASSVNQMSSAQMLIEELHLMKEHGWDTSKLEAIGKRWKNTGDRLQAAQLAIADNKTTGTIASITGDFIAKEYDF